MGISIWVEHSRQNPPVRILPRDRPCPVGWARSDAKQAYGFAQIRADTLGFEIYVIIFSGYQFAISIPKTIYGVSLGSTPQKRTSSVSALSRAARFYIFFDFGGSCAHIEISHKFDPAPGPKALPRDRT